MSALTDRLYRAWLVSNGYAGPRGRGPRGMGAVAPMVTRQRPFNGVVRVAEPSRRGSGDARLDQQKKTPASVGTAPGVLTNIGDCNVDRADCRS